MVNLDTMSADALDALADRIFRDTSTTARELFPRQPRATEVTFRLGVYAGLRAMAKRSRAAGDWFLASKQEAKCQDIYARLPGWARMVKL